MRHIASRDNTIFKSLRALANDPRETRRQQRTLADGIHLVTTCLQRGARIQQLLVSESGQASAEIQALLAEAGDVDYLVMRDTLFSEISGVTTPTGIAAVITTPPEPMTRIMGDAVLLDAVQDAGNVGAILRTAAAAGVRDVVLGSGCAGAWSPRVLRAGQGAHFSLNIREQSNLLAVMSACHEQSLITVATVARDGESLFTQIFDQPVIWLFGNEGSGVSAELVGAASRRVTIPLAAQTESLNVAATAAVCLFEVSRQRQAVQPSSVIVV